MKLKVSARLFSEACAAAAGATSAKSATPMVSNFHLRAENGVVKVRATDLETTISTECAAEIESEGIAVLNAARLMAMVREVPEDSLTIEMQNGFHASIKSGVAEFKLYGVDPIEFPTERKSLNATTVECDASVISDAFNRIRFAVSEDATRYMLTGINLDARDGRIRCVATDARRLAYTDIPIAEGVAFECVIPAKAVGLVARGSGIKGKVRIEVSEGGIYFVSETGYIYTKLLDGKFPDYHKILPARESKPVIFQKEALRGATRRVAAVQVKQQAAVTLEISGDSAKVSLVTSEIGEFKEVQQITNPANVGLTVGVNPDYMMEALNVLSGAEVPLDFGTEMDPIRLDALPELYYLMMPVRIQS